MNDDPIALLERELVEAARRRTDGRGAARPFFLGRLAGGFTIAAALAITVVIVAGALILLGGRSRPAGHAAAVAGRQRLLDTVGVLRRPQTRADLHSPVIARLLSSYTPGREPWSRWGSPDRGLIRRAGVASWGEPVFLVPVKPASDRGQEGLLVATRSFVNCCATAADMVTSGIVQNWGQASGRRGGHGNAVDRFLAVVPDGVAKVQLGRLVMQVHDNLATAQASGNLVGPVPVILWFGPDGSVIRRIGDLAGAYRSVPVSPPGPETAASRAAEREPSTHNPVWVTPREGGPRAAFTVHFRVLLNAAGYAYTITGGSCRALWGVRGAPDDSRGRIWSDGVVPVRGKSWCPGTYRLSVAVSDLGVKGMPRHRSRPFGTATFVVR